jgi:ketosteroid isomerase-like protein
MTSNAPVLDVERQFFDALLAPSSEALERLLGDDFLLIDVMTGSEISKPAFLDFMASGQLVFTSIQPGETRVRTYGSVAVVTGHTEMHGTVGENAFSARSRYTHIYAEQDGRWRMVSAQGTPIAI